MIKARFVFVPSSSQRKFVVLLASVSDVRETEGSLGPILGWPHQDRQDASRRNFLLSMTVSL